MKCPFYFIFIVLNHQQKIFSEGIQIWKQGQGRNIFLKDLLFCIIKISFLFTTHFSRLIFIFSFKFPNTWRSFHCVNVFVLNINFLLNRLLQKAKIMIYGSYFRGWVVHKIFTPINTLMPCQEKLLWVSFFIHWQWSPVSHRAHRLELKHPCGYVNSIREACPPDDDREMVVTPAVFSQETNFI